MRTLLRQLHAIIECIMDFRMVVFYALYVHMNNVLDSDPIYLRVFVSFGCVFVCVVQMKFAYLLFSASNKQAKSFFWFIIASLRWLLIALQEFIYA